MEVLTWRDVDDGAGYPALIRYQLQGATGDGHSHTFYEIVYVEDGFCLHRCNETSSLLMAGDLIALRPGDVHTYRGQRNVSIVNFLFTREALHGVLPEILSLPGMEDFFGNAPSARPSHRNLSPKDRERVRDFFRALGGEREARQPGWAVRSKALVLDFLVFFARLPGAGLPARGETPYTGYVAEALAIIESSYHEALTISGIAARVGVSPDHLTRQFRQALGITPLESLRRYRFARALELLRRGEAVGEVYKTVGFRHFSHFSREFKTLFDMTPTAFQRQSGRHK